MQLRDYQVRTNNLTWEWMSNNEGHLCVVLPTGAGKSVVIADIIKTAMQSWPETRVLMACHVKELVEQNASKIKTIWPGAPMGIYSAGLKKRDLGEPITFAGIQSIRSKAKQLGRIDLFVIDECHLVSHKNEGGYRNLINELLSINPAMRVIGYSATPYRLGHGYITYGDALFDDLIEPVTVEELIYKGYLSPVRSKVTDLKLDVSGVHKRGGEFIESELQAAVNVPMKNAQVVDEVIKLAGKRKAWLFFCTGVAHAEAIAELLRERGVSAACITGETPNAERDRLLSEYKAGRIQALTNANVLTTGFDYPDIDLVAMLRPTLSPTLYVQMVGRGMRLKSNADHCLVLDFAGVVQAHGPITQVRPPKQAGKGTGEAPVKICDNCAEIVHLSARECGACGYVFPVQERKFELHDVDILGSSHEEMELTGWSWRSQISKKTEIEMLVVTYYGALSDKPVTEYLTVAHPGRAGMRARQTLFELTSDSMEAKKAIQTAVCLSDVCHIMDQLPPPDSIKYAKNGKFFDIKARIYNA